MPSSSTSTSSIEQPLTVFESPVLTEWIDYNGHMNDACYVVAFSHSVEEFMAHIDLHEAFREEHSVSIYTLQSMVTYLKEVSEGENIVIKGQLLESDAKKLRLFLTMHHATTHDELATMETLLLHMDMKNHRPAPFLPHTLSLVERIQTAHNGLATPANAGQPIQMRRPKPQS
ncbi:thioesterase family protein [Marinomonas sp. GJ51-6]|uniref:thioesterase family protein n=1 Tax=Marinomonas sp. GJ51-6 TaxID=2992802 RepID=UPI0029350EF4|nr:thioesterase family protein [Marinomonas sp. GJ51-6]WOD06070.1 thioesterase family protein [Marinomonas sp. GJ51-6]